MPTNAILSPASAYMGHGNHEGGFRVTARFTGQLTAGRLLIGGNPQLPAAFTPGIRMNNMLQPAPALCNDNNFLEIYDTVVRYGPVTACTVASGICTVTIATGHDLLPGEFVAIRRVLGAVEANGTYIQVLTTPTDTTFTFALAAVTAFSTSADSIVEVRRPFPDMVINAMATSTATFTTSAAHELAVGDQVFITRITGITGQVFQRLIQTVATVPSATTFTIAGLSSVGGAATVTNAKCILVRSARTFGQISLFRPRSLPIVSVSIAALALFTTQDAHGLQVGQIVESAMIGTTVSTSGVKRVRTTPLATTFTLEELDGTLVTGVGTTVTGNVGHVAGLLQIPDGLRLESIGTLMIPIAPNQARYVGPLNL